MYARGSMSKGPIYGVELIDVMPLGQFGTGSTLQAMPSADDLRRVCAVSERTVAGYEVLLGHFRRQKLIIKLAEQLIQPGDDGPQLLGARQFRESLLSAVRGMEWTGPEA